MSRKKDLDPGRCIQQVRMQTNLPRYHQCTRARTHGDYCWQHAPEVVTVRQDARNRREGRKWQRELKRRYGPAFYAALEDIANGHNDPRGRAREALDLVKDKEEA